MESLVTSPWFTFLLDLFMFYFFLNWIIFFFNSQTLLSETAASKQLKTTEDKQRERWDWTKTIKSPDRKPEQQNWGGLWCPVILPCPYLFHILVFMQSVFNIKIQVTAAFKKIQKTTVFTRKLQHVFLKMKRTKTTFSRPAICSFLWLKHESSVTFNTVSAVQLPVAQLTWVWLTD